MKRMKEIWKRFLLWIGAAVLLITAGCAKAPDASVIAKTNTEQLVSSITEQASSDVPPATDHLAAQLGTPERIEDVRTDANGKLVINYHAAVVVPDATAMPIYRVEPAEFSQAQVKGLFDAYCGNVPMYETGARLTKQQIEAAIRNHEAYLADPATDESDREYSTIMLPELKEMLASAPDQSELPLSDGTLQKYDELLGDKYLVGHTGIETRSEDGAYIMQVRNNRDNTEELVWEDYDVNGNPAGQSSTSLNRNASAFMAHDLGDHVFNNILLRAPLPLSDTEVPQAAGGKLTIAPADVQKMVDGFLTSAGVANDMAVREIYLVDNSDPSNGIPKASDYCYYVVCTRHLNGIPCSYLHNAVPSSLSGDGCNSWGYEELCAYVDDDGIFLLQWMSPITVIETVTDHTELKPFNEIKEIIRKMLSVKWSEDAKQAYCKSCTIEVNRIELSLQRITDQKQFDQGLLIPVWNVVGTVTTVGEYTAVECGSLLSVNAIDGSIIDVAQGY